ncbi:MAG: UbiX family flavin prenyltransferase, partial [Thermodesulfobacteriota bacterium]|nr:UbiX family flavin prenyltransferase [Thermodesulfobacteriota bacterium]
MTRKKRILLTVTGASGMAYAQTLATALGQNKDIELHMIVSRAGLKVLEVESGARPEELTAPAARVYEPEDIGAPCASGSWTHQGMVVCPCSMSTLAAIANGTGLNLIHRAADVSLKERRPLILVARETPLSSIHLENMLKASRAGAVIAPACPAFYLRP